MSTDKKCENVLLAMYVFYDRQIFLDGKDFTSLIFGRLQRKDYVQKISISKLTICGLKCCIVFLYGHSNFPQAIWLGTLSLQEV